MRHQQTTAQFRQARDAANEASLAKSRFLATASHEFRTPLTTVQAAIDLLLRYRDKMDEAQEEEYLHDVTRQVKTITRLLDNLLLVGEEDATDIVFQPETIKLADVCEDMLRQMRLGTEESEDLKSVSSEIAKLHLWMKGLSGGFSRTCCLTRSNIRRPRPKSRSA